MAGSLRRLSLFALIGAGAFVLGVTAEAPSSFAQSSSKTPLDSTQDGTPSSAATRMARGAREGCDFPWSYSRGLRRCVCVRAGHSLQRGDCLPEGASTSCRDDEIWSPDERACLCGAGLRREGIGCVAEDEEDPSPAADDAVTEEAESSTAKEKAVARSQRCLKELGFYNGSIDGELNPDTWTAYWHFKREHDLKRYGDVLAEPVQEKFASLCKDVDETASLPLDTPVQEPPPIETPASAPSAVAATPSETPRPKRTLDLDCLSEDLLSFRGARGGVPVAQCGTECLPKPKDLSEADLAEMESQNGVVWCSACVPVQGRLTLEDVRRIEDAGKIELCATPPKQVLRHAGGVAGQSYTRVRELYRPLAPAPEDDAAFALVIGNRNYASLPAAESSHSDAGAMYAFLTEHLGFRQDNVIDVRDAKKADLERLFGATPGAEGELTRKLRSHKDARVIVYYSGHGATDAAQTETYLLPVDTERYRDERSGYPLATLYANLESLDAKSVLLLLETDFGRDHDNYVMPPNLPETRRSAIPVVPRPGVTVLAAADRGQRTLADPLYGIGLFTRYLIEGLAGSADLPPVGNEDGKLDSAELHVYTAEMVRLAARKTFGLLQSPVYSSAAAAVLSSASGAFAERPN